MDTPPFAAGKPYQSQAHAKLQDLVDSTKPKAPRMLKNTPSFGYSMQDFKDRQRVIDSANRLNARADSYNKANKGGLSLPKKKNGSTSTSREGWKAYLQVGRSWTIR